MAKLTIADICNLQMDYYYQNPAAIMAGLHGAIAADDEESVSNIFTECQSRGIDVAKIIADDLKRHDAIWGETSTR